MRSVTLLVIFSLAIPVFAQTKQERTGIVNFTKVDAVVACGGATETSALDGLAKDGFKSVINLRLATEANANIELNAAHAKSLGLNYIHIPFNGQQPDPKAVDQFLAAIANKANQPVYVHCGSASRVGSYGGRRDWSPPVSKSPSSASGKRLLVQVVPGVGVPGVRQLVVVGRGAGGIDVAL